MSAPILDLRHSQGSVTHLDSQGGFSYTAVSQHHQLVQCHFPRHDGQEIGGLSEQGVGGGGLTAGEGRGGGGN